MDYVPDDELFTCPDCGRELPHDAPVSMIRWGNTLRALCPECWGRRAVSLTN